MKKILGFALIAVLFVAPFEGFSKKKKCVAPVTKTVNVDSIALDNALMIGDYETAIVFSHRILAKDPQNIQNLSSLAKLYFHAQKFELSINTCNQIVLRDSMNMPAMELAALSFKQLKNNEAAMNLYFDMSKRFNNPSFLYQIAVLYFEAKNLDNCLKVLGEIAKDTTATNFTIDMTRKNAAGKFLKEKINLLAAVHNIAGFIALEQKQLPQAKAYFEKALAIEPSFVLAENNLKEVLNLSKEGPSPKKDQK